MLKERRNTIFNILVAGDKVAEHFEKPGADLGVTWDMLRFS